MQSREPRFSLRFEAGDRRGELLPLSEGTSTLGRRPDNALVVADGSVSGRHAELTVTGGEVRLRDLGSTNGTRVGSERVEARVLAHGDDVVFGNVRFTLLDRALADAAPSASAAPDGAPDALGQISAALGQISAADVASTGKRSIGALLLLLVLVAAAALVWLRLGKREHAVVASVPLVEGNLLADGSFEADLNTAWEAADAAPQAFFLDGTYAKSGSTGLGAELAAGEWALAFSPPIALPQRRLVRARASLFLAGDVTGRLGIELSSRGAEHPAFIAWAPASSAESDGGAWEELELAFDTLPDFESGRVVVAARAAGEGSAALDDVSVVLENATAGATASFKESEARVLGTPGSTLALATAGRVVLSGLGFGPWSASGLAGSGSARLSAEAGPKGFTVAWEGAGGDEALRFDATPRSDGADEGWIATLGPSGFRAHASEFENDDTTDLLLGRGIHLIRVGFPEPVRVRGSVRGGSLSVSAEVGSASGIELQLDFHEERAEAAQLAQSAEGATARRDYGEALAAWQRLLDEFPFEVQLVQRAGGERAQLVQQGSEALDRVRRDVERARFFALADLFLQCRERAVEIGTIYRGSEVQRESEALAREIDGELDALPNAEKDRHVDDVRSVLGALDPESSPALVEHVRAYIESHDTARER